MLVLSPFSNMRIRIQALKRVGRFNDDCKRIQNDEVNQIDARLASSYKGNLDGQFSLLEKLIKENALNNPQSKSVLQKIDQCKDKPEEKDQLLLDQAAKLKQLEVKRLEEEKAKQLKLQQEKDEKDRQKLLKDLKNQDEKKKAQHKADEKQLFKGAKKI